MFKIVSIILSVVIFAISCSKSCKEENKEVEKQQQTEKFERMKPQIKFEEKEKKEFKEKEEKKVEKEEEKTEQKEEAKKEENIEKYLGYPWELLKYPEIKEKYLKSIGKLKNIFWIRSLNSVASENKLVRIDDKDYIYIFFCKPHDCGYNYVVMLFDPKKKEFFGYYLTGDRKVKIGNLDKKKEKLLKIALNELGETDALKKINRNKLVKAEDVIEGKLEKCPPIYKVITLKPATKINLDPKIYNLILKTIEKEYELSDEELKNIRKEDVYVAFVDLNDDGKEDIIFSVYGMLFCGSAGCNTYALINRGNGKYKIVYLGLTEDNKLLLTKKKVKGFRIIIKNEHLMLIYNGKAYQIGGECYVK
jgi:hypothetical protein